MRFTKKIRQQIVQEFCERHGGVFDATVFLDEVTAQGAKHPAFGWFEWDSTKAAREFQLIQARNFVNDLTIRFSIETIERKGIVVVETIMPMLISPLNMRNSGGGYLLNDPTDQSKMGAYCNEAATALQTWLNRYGAAVLYIGAKTQPFEQLIERFEGLELAGDGKELTPAE